MSYTIAEAAEKLGLTTHTLRYYERDGLMLVPVERAGSGHRRYTDGDLEWITMLVRLRSTGMPICDVRRYADLVRAGEGNEDEGMALLQAHREAVLVQLAEVTEHLGAIDYKIGIYAHTIDERSRTEVA